jgi:hypothetical protein
MAEQQPEALHLADLLEGIADICRVARPAAAELRRLQAENTELRAALSRLQAGGGDLVGEVDYVSDTGMSNEATLYEPMPWGTKLYTHPAAPACLSQGAESDPQAGLSRTDEPQPSAAPAKATATIEESTVGARLFVNGVEVPSWPIGCAYDEQKRAVCDAINAAAAPAKVLVPDISAACIGYARLDGNEYKLASMRRHPVTADGKLHPIFVFTEEQVEAMQAAHNGLTLGDGGEG